MRRLKFFAGSVLLTILLGLSISGCDMIPPVQGGEPSISVTYQDATATVTATWDRPINAQPDWELFYEWTNTRTSGGNGCEKEEATTQLTATWTCTRSQSTSGQMLFTLRAVRMVDGARLPSADVTATYAVAPMVVVPEPPGNLKIEVASRRIFQNRDRENISPDDTATLIQYQFSPATYRHVDYRWGETETFHYEVWVDGEKIGYTVDASWGIVNCAGAENGEVCPVDPFRGDSQERLS